MLCPSAKYLVVDTSAFIKSVSFNKIGENICTIPEVIEEIKNKRQYRHLYSLTTDVEIMNVFSESTAAVVDFSKKTGDYPSLSATDLKLLALTYQLETQFVGKEHLRESPTIKQFKVNERVKNDHPMSNHGLQLPLKIKDYEQKPDKLRKTARNEVLSQFGDKGQNISSEDSDSSDEQSFEDSKTVIEDDHYDTANESLSSNSEAEFGACELEDESFSDECESSEPTDFSSDDDSWITPRNVSQLKQSTGGTLADKNFVTVACLTTDFAIQNVLMQMGLNVLTVDGKVIKELRTYILRCYACFKTTSNMKKVFCPNCGNKTLKRVSVFLDKDGNKRMFINFKKPISTRGKRFSLPTPKGGKHSVNPRLVEDARRPHQKPSKLARLRTNALEEDYVAGYSPFVMRDVHSKSAQLGFNKGKPVLKYWMRRNPNESKRMPKS